MYAQIFICTCCFCRFSFAAAALDGAAPKALQRGDALVQRVQSSIKFREDSRDTVSYMNGSSVSSHMFPPILRIESLVPSFVPTQKASMIPYLPYFMPMHKREMRNVHTLVHFLLFPKWLAMRLKWPTGRHQRSQSWLVSGSDFSNKFLLVLCFSVGENNALKSSCCTMPVPHIYGDKGFQLHSELKNAKLKNTGRRRRRH